MAASRTLGADTVDFIGEECLTNFTVDSDTELQLTLSDNPIRSVQYSIGIYGVTAIRMRYEDDSTFSMARTSATISVHEGYEDRGEVLNHPPEIGVKTGVRIAFLSSNSQRKTNRGQGHKITHLKFYSNGLWDQIQDALWDRDIWERLNVSVAAMAYMLIS